MLCRCKDICDGHLARVYSSSHLVDGGVDVVYLVIHVGVVSLVVEVVKLIAQVVYEVVKRSVHVIVSNSCVASSASVSE